MTAPPPEVGAPEAAEQPPGAPAGGRAALGRVGRDVGANTASLAAVAICGLGLNLIIGRVYGAATLGVFNQVVAAYILFSQAATGGVNESVLRAVANHTDLAERRRILLGGLGVTVAASAGFSTLFWLAGPSVARLLESPGVATGMAVAAPGLFCFAINKTLLGAVNGLRRMRAFAAYQASRYLLLLAGLVLAWRLAITGDCLAGIFTFAELLLLLILLAEVAGQRLLRPTAGGWSWALVHLRYGAKSILSGMLLELNARIDVLMLGLLIDDRQVGIYSLAAFAAEGIFQLIFVLQNVFNPLLASHLARGQMGELGALIRSSRRWILPGAVAVSLLAVTLYPWTLPVWAAHPEFAASSLPFALLTAGILLGSPYLPFFKTLLMANQPGWHTLFVAAVVALNVAANAVLIPSWGIVGAAAATGMALALSGLLLSGLVRWRVGLRL